MSHLPLDLRIECLKMDVIKVKGDAWKKTQAQNFTISRKIAIFMQFSWYQAKLPTPEVVILTKFHGDCKKIIDSLLRLKLLACALFYASPFKWTSTHLKVSPNIPCCQDKLWLIFQIWILESVPHFLRHTFQTSCRPDICPVLYLRAPMIPSESYNMLVNMINL